jgi:hypothetical protein
MSPPQNPQPSQPQQKPPFEERLTDAVVTLLMTGSGGYALYSLYVDDVPKAAIAALVSAGAGFLNQSWQALLKPVAGWWKARLGRTGETFRQQVEQFDQTISGVSKQYLEALKGYCQDLEVEGYKGYLSALPLKDVYVPLKIDADPGKLLKLEAPKTIWDFIPKVNDPSPDSRYRRLAIIANPGFGKTTLTRYLTLSFADQSYKSEDESRDIKGLFPVLLLLRTIYSQIQDETTPLLLDLMVQQIKRLPKGHNLPPFEQWLRTQLQKGELLIMFDGLDEVPVSHRERVSRWINWQMQAYSSQFILTSRPHGYDSTLFRGVQQIAILAFTNKDKDAFIRQWYQATLWIHKWEPLWRNSQRKSESERLTLEQAEAQSQAEARERAEDLYSQIFGKKAEYLNALAENPLLVTIIAATHQAFDSLPRYRKDLYKRIFDLLLEHRPNRRETRLTIPTAEDNQKILQVLALNLIQNEQTQFTTAQGAEWIEARLTQLRPDESLTPETFLRQIQDISGVLAGGESDLYQFTHKTFQEYLAALELMQQRKGALVTEQFHNSNWEEVICFYAALTDPVPFIDFALENPTEYTLNLAQRLRGESTRVNDEQYQRLLNARRNLLPESEQDRLKQQFAALLPLNDQTAITSDSVTWGEYSLFLKDQAEGRFHSWAEELLIGDSMKNEPVDDDIDWEDARWFCAWLSTQTNLAPDDGVYDYRLPTPDELTAVGAVREPPLPNAPTPLPHAEPPLQTHEPPLQTHEPPLPNAPTPLRTHEPPLHPWTSDPNRPGNALRVVRQRIPDRYRELVNYLANGRWKEADQETLDVMLEVTNQKEQGYFSIESIRNFPCDDLRIIDQLWVKFSGGKFGFSVQKEIWVEVGGKLDFGEDGGATRDAYRKMSDINGWRKDSQYISYSLLIFDTSAPKGHLPSPAALRKHYSSLASRLVKCKA